MTSKEIELFNIEQFLQLAKYNIVDFKPSERPDSIFTLTQSGQEENKDIGIEHTDYYNDAIPGTPSPGQLLYDFWGVVTSIIESRIDDRSEFHKVHGRLRLNKQQLEEKAKSVNSKQEGNTFSEAIANELYDLVDRFLQSPDQEQTYCTYRRHPEDTLPIPDSYAVLNQYFLQIDLEKVDIWQSIFHGWRANIHAACIGLSTGKLIEIVNDKRTKCRGYNTDNLEEIWLLIAAPATTVHNATSNHPGVVSKLDNEELRNACELSGFDKVFFFSRMPPEWFRQIWPT